MSTVWGDEKDARTKGAASLPTAHHGSQRVDEHDATMPAWVQRSILLRIASACVLALYVWASVGRKSTFESTAEAALLSSIWGDKEPLCPQESPLSPSHHNELIDGLNEWYSSAAFEKKALKLLSGAVQIPTENFDDMGPVGNDSRWDIFTEFHSYLLSSFPLVHTSLKLTKVNTYGLVYKWEGSDPSLKPILLLGHQDVVPVNKEVLDQWEHPPYSGHFDGKFLWGRGSCDDKSMLISLFTSFETLLSKDFKPSRTIFLASGFDEETGGARGASSIAEYLLATYGEDYFALVLDEGAGHYEVNGGRFSMPAVAEKGWQDVKIEISTKGGHSSIPPAHTSIGMLADAIIHLENHPQHPHLDRASPFYSLLLCQAEHAPDIPHALKQLLKKSVKSDAALGLVLPVLLKHDEGRLIRSVLSTTQAIDLIRGGVKINALPEHVETSINHRVAMYSSTKENADRLKTYLAPIAKKYHLALDAFGSNITDVDSADTVGTMRLSDASNGRWLEPSPITPTNEAPYALLSGTIRQSWNAGSGSGVKATHEPIFVAPGLMGGNTDTRWFWKLSKHIFRYSHLGEEDFYNGAHTTNEAVRFKAVIEQVRFFTYFVLNADETTTL